MFSFKKLFRKLFKKKFAIHDFTIGYKSKSWRDSHDFVSFYINYKRKDHRFFLARERSTILTHDMMPINAIENLVGFDRVRILVEDFLRENLIEENNNIIAERKPWG